MAVAFYMDVHIPQAATDQLRRRAIDVLTASEDGAERLPDDQLLDRATSSGRVMVTFDIRFHAMAEEWQRRGRSFGGLIFVHPLRTSIGQLVRDLEVIALASDMDDWQNYAERLPL